MRSIWKYRYYLLLLVLLGGSGYYYYQKNYTTSESVSYETEAVAKDDISVTVTGSGQIANSNEISVTSKVSGKLLALNVKAGDVVKSGDVVAQVDSSDAQEEIDNANISLEQANLDYEALYDPPTELEQAQAEDAVAAAKRNLASLQEAADASDIKTAETSLEKAKNDLAELKLKNEDNVRSLEYDIESAKDDLADAHDDVYNAISSTFVELPDIKQNLDDVLHSKSIAESEIVISDSFYNVDFFQDSVEGNDDSYQIDVLASKADESYYNMKELYDTCYDHYVAIDRDASTDDLAALLDETVELAKSFSKTVRDETDLINYWVDYRNDKDQKVYDKVNSIKDDLGNETTKINDRLSSLQSIQSLISDKEQTLQQKEENLVYAQNTDPLEVKAAELSVTDAEDKLNDLKDGGDADEIAQAEENLKEKELALKKLSDGPDETTVKSKKLSISQKTKALQNAQESLDDYTIKSTIDGIVGEVGDVVVGQDISNSAKIATIISKNKVAEMVVNETDISKIKVGQKVNVGIDAIDGLSLVGEVAEIDAIGTVSSGVVSYNIKVALKTDDDRVMSGMSVSGVIIVETKSDVLLVPVDTVTENDDGSFSVKVMNNGVVTEQEVELGLTDDTSYEVTSGLTEGQEIVTKEVKSSSTTSSSSSSSSTSSSSSSSSKSITQMMSGGGGGPMGGGPGGM
ncbi:MAG TPA: efflux RND transporter periplasmic adaptor subunit [bacterium]|nr:efflux RND transporter periplasmic adaptor subunit [bacterium]